MVKQIYRYLRNEYYLMRWRKNKVRFLNGVKLDRRCIFEGNNSIGEDNSLKKCSLGTGTYTGQNVKLTSVRIGRFCSIASNIRNIVGHHPTTGFVSTHPCFFSVGKAAGFTFAKKQLFTETRYVADKYLVTIGNDVWIGDNVTIMDNVKIGDGAIIGANSLVTKSIEPYSINFGNPSRLVRYRFDEETRAFLLNSKWWDRDLEWLRENYLIFSDTQSFKKVFGQ